jgi:hypothetical protein
MLQEHLLNSNVAYRTSSFLDIAVVALVCGACGAQVRQLQQHQSQQLPHRFKIKIQKSSQETPRDPLRLLHAQVHRYVAVQRK